MQVKLQPGANYNQSPHQQPAVQPSLPAACGLTNQDLHDIMPASLHDIMPASLHDIMPASLHDIMPASLHESNVFAWVRDSSSSSSSSRRTQHTVPPA
jgi:hypothetical protein